MKNLAKIIASALALIMLAALAMAPASAAATDGKITVKPPSGFTVTAGNFKAYKILNVTYDVGKENYSYAIDSDFVSFTDFSETQDETLVEYIASLNDDSAALNALAAKLWAYITANHIMEEGTAALDADAKNVEITGLDHGYYLVFGTGVATSGDVTIVAACALTTTDPTVEVTLKVDAPTLEKKVSDEEGGTYSTSTSLNIGDTVYFKVSSNVPNMTGYKEYTFTVHDKMSAGLTYNSNSVVVKIDNATITSLITVKESGFGDECTLEIIFPPEYFAELTQGLPIDITYSATLNASAVVGPGANGNKNSAYLEYSNDPYGEGPDGPGGPDFPPGTTPPTEAVVYTYAIDIFKYTGTLGGADEKPLAGAQFTLTRILAASPAGFVLVSAGDASHQASYRVATETDKSNSTYTTTVTSPASGKIHVEGLAADVYDLAETVAPGGYNKLDGPIEVTITKNDDSGDYDVGWAFGSDSGADTINVENVSGGLFPATGGVGLPIFIVGGLILILIAAIMLINRKNTGKTKN